jgi:hypothetical protein
MRNISLVALLLLLVFGACKKDDTSIIVPDPVEPAAKRFMGFTYENNKYAPVTVEYDSKGRVSRFDDGGDVSTLTYSGSEVSISEWRTEDNREVFKFKGKLNPAGKLTEGSGTSEYNKGMPRQVKYTFEYNADGYMTRKVQNYDNGTTVYDYRYTYTNGNLTSFQALTNGVYEYGGHWEYDTAREDKMGINWNHFNPANQFTGKTNRNIATKYTGVRPGTADWHSTSTFVYDTEGYPLSCAVNVSNGTSYKLLYQFK